MVSGVCCTTYNKHTGQGLLQDMKLLQATVPCMLHKHKTLKILQPDWCIPFLFNLQLIALKFRYDRFNINTEAVSAKKGSPPLALVLLATH